MSDDEPIVPPRPRPRIVVRWRKPVGCLAVVATLALAALGVAHAHRARRVARAGAERVRLRAAIVARGFPLDRERDRPAPARPADAVLRSIHLGDMDSALGARLERMRTVRDPIDPGDPFATAALDAARAFVAPFEAPLAAALATDGIAEPAHWSVVRGFHRLAWATSLRGPIAVASGDGRRAWECLADRAGLLVLEPHEPRWPAARVVRAEDLAGDLLAAHALAAPTEPVARRLDAALAALDDPTHVLERLRARALAFEAAADPAPTERSPLLANAFAAGPGTALEAEWTRFLAPAVHGERAAAAWRDLEGALGGAVALPAERAAQDGDLEAALAGLAVVRALRLALAESRAPGAAGLVVGDPFAPGETLATERRPDGTVAFLSRRHGSRPTAPSCVMLPPRKR